MYLIFIICLCVRASARSRFGDLFVRVAAGPRGAHNDITDEDALFALPPALAGCVHWPVRRRRELLREL